MRCYWILILGVNLRLIIVTSFRWELLSRQGERNFTVSTKSSLTVDAYTTLTWSVSSIKHAKISKNCRRIDDTSSTGKAVNLAVIYFGLTSNQIRFHNQHALARISIFAISNCRPFAYLSNNISHSATCKRLVNKCLCTFTFTRSLSIQMC